MDERGCSAHLPRIRAEREKEKKGERGRGEFRKGERRKEDGVGFNRVYRDVKVINVQCTCHCPFSAPAGAGRCPFFLPNSGPCTGTGRRRPAPFSGTGRRRPVPFLPPQLRPRHRPAPAGALFTIPVSASVSLAPIGPNSEFVGSDRTNFETHDRFYVQSMPVPIIKLRYTHTLHQMPLCCPCVVLWPGPAKTGAGILRAAVSVGGGNEGNRDSEDVTRPTDVLDFW